MTTHQARTTWRFQGRGLVLVRDIFLVIVAIVIDLLIWHQDSQLRTGGRLQGWIIPVVATALYATLLVRSRDPLVVFGIMWAYGFIGLLVPGYEPFTGLLIALYSVARLSTSLPATSALVLTAIPFGINTYNSVETSQSITFWTVAITAIAWGALTVTVWGFGRLSYSAAHKAEQARLWQLADADRALRDERLRLARELHDIVAHSVSAMILQAAGAKAVLAREESAAVRSALGFIEDSGVQAMNELHRLLKLLRTTEGADQDPVTAADPGLQDIAELVTMAARSGLEIKLIENGVPVAVDANAELAAYRVIQEALTNVTKHASPSSSVSVIVNWSTTNLSVAVRDTGTTEPGQELHNTVLSAGLGLKGLTERVQLLGGTLTAGNVGAGFLVQADLPLHRSRSERVQT